MRIRTRRHASSCARVRDVARSSRRPRSPRSCRRRGSSSSSAPGGVRARGPACRPSRGSTCGAGSACRRLRRRGRRSSRGRGPGHGSRARRSSRGRGLRHGSRDRRSSSSLARCAGLEPRCAQARRSSCAASPADRIAATRHRRLLYAGVVIRGLGLACCVVLCVAACGGARHAATTTAPPKPTRCVSPKALAKLHRDVAALERAAALPTSSTLLGNAAINRATDRFLNDVSLAPITNLERNRMIDHAAGALGGACQQCFEALEAARPIPSLRMGDTGC
jgi:hypothetical protein